MPAVTRSSARGDSKLNLCAAPDSPDTVPQLGQAKATLMDAYQALVHQTAHNARAMSEDMELVVPCEPAKSSS